MAGRLLLATLAVATAATAITATPAHAHRTHPTVYARVDAVEPAVPDAVVEVRAGIADQLLVVNFGDVPIEVLDADGRPFLRIAKDVVHADLSRPAWAASLVPYPVPSRPGAKPGWTLVARQGSWAWFDHRLHDTDRTADLAAGSRVPVRLGDWTVPLVRGGTTHRVRGHVEARPVLGQFRSKVVSKPDGVDVDVLDGRVPGLFLRWRGDGDLVVKGIDGEPFARLRKDTAEVNEASATWRDDRALRGEPVPPNPSQRWLAQGATLTWLDRRLAYTPGVPPDAALRRTKPTTVVEWDLPVEVAGKAATISGETTWHPTSTGTTNDLVPYAAAAAVAAATAVVLVVAARGRRRRRVET